MMSGAVEMGSAVTGPPMRGFTPFDKRSGVVPWSSWQREESASVLHGLAAYHRRTAWCCARTCRSWCMRNDPRRCSSPARTRGRGAQRHHQ